MTSAHWSSSSLILSENNWYVSVFFPGFSIRLSTCATTAHVAFFSCFSPFSSLSGSLGFLWLVAEKSEEMFSHQKKHWAYRPHTCNFCSAQTEVVQKFGPNEADVKGPLSQRSVMSWSWWAAARLFVVFFKDTLLTFLSRRPFPVTNQTVQEYTLN